MPLTAPTLHLNGSGFAHLDEGYLAAVEALRAALEAVQATGPNARDYYPAGDGAYRAALAEHKNRLAKVREVLDELCAVHSVLVDANDARSRR
jgi:hypothetical protein